MIGLSCSQVVNYWVRPELKRMRQSSLCAHENTYPHACTHEACMELEPPAPRLFSNNEMVLPCPAAFSLAAVTQEWLEQAGFNTQTHLLS